MLVPVILLAIAPALVSAACKCGFSTGEAADDGTHLLFTNMLESDFTNMESVSETNDGVPQQFNVSAQVARGRYGKSFSPSNIVARPKAIAEPQDSGSSAVGGLGLRVESTVRDGTISVAEVDSANMDMHWGSYRAGLKLTPVRGTCAAFFWYFNDTQEIDMEFLSQDYDAEKKKFPVNLVIQSQQSMEAGFDASKTGNYKRVNLPFDPTAGFHEYRFDYLPGRVAFYADSSKLADMEGAEMPTSAGHLILQHWSNGDPKWSGGPPKQDTVFLVSYVKAYFNSSGSQGFRGDQCADPICIIPDVTASNASTGGRFLGDAGTKKKDENGGSQMQSTNWAFMWTSTLLAALIVMTSK
ncbi:hypothetical protein HIM_04511 [Hirsutella minnesotensis 3608]|uniref:GH16 domain-containing protein n=1 Tax=Hirsutella minnesotensis 3608 TaxID=1043627 RepID=A0A0F7ZPT4_9HYPO|nr:hypothetical protein HIM_04511 [Hirsutella minnesotensis 3608]